MKRFATPIAGLFHYKRFTTLRLGRSRGWHVSLTLHRPSLPPATIPLPKFPEGRPVPKVPVERQRVPEIRGPNGEAY